MQKASHRLFVGKDRHKFSAAHMTVFPDGTKERLHGHNFRVEVAVELHSIDFDKFLDFSVIKRALEEQCKEWDERVLLAAQCPFFQIVREDQGELEFRLCGKRYVLPEEEVVRLPLANITVETLAVAFLNGMLGRTDSHFKRAAKSLEVTIRESDGQGGSYRIELG